jgi:hypothetical protein
MEDTRIIYDLLQEVRSEQKKHFEEITNQNLILVSIQKDVSKNTVDLGEHMRRTDLLEQQTDILRQSTDDKFLKLNDKLEVAEGKIQQLEWPSKVKEFLFSKYMKFGGAIALAVGLVYEVLRIFKVI